MSSRYKQDREWADRFIEKQREIIAPILGSMMLRIADFHVDTKLAGDLSVLRSSSFNIGLRVRRPEYAKTYGLLEFTLRYQLSNGVETELAKIQRGLGGWFGYFHSDDNFNLPHWMIIDLESFRRNFKPGGVIQNKDGTTSLCVFRLNKFPVGLLIAASESVLAELTPQHRLAISRRMRGEWDPNKKIVSEIIATNREQYLLTGDNNLNETKEELHARQDELWGWHDTRQRSKQR